MIPTLSDSDCQRLLPLVRRRRHRGFLSSHDKIACITGDRILFGRGIDKSAALRIVDEQSVLQNLYRVTSIPLAEVTQITARRGGKRTRLLSMRVDSPSSRIKFHVDQDEAGHFLQLLQTKLPDKLTVRDRVPLHGWGFNFVLLAAASLAILLLTYLNSTMAGMIVLCFSVLPLTIVQIYDHLPAGFPWEDEAKAKKKKKKPVKDRSGVEPFRSKILGWSLKIAAVLLLLVFFVISELWLFSPIALVLLYLGNMLATVPPRLVRQSDTRAPILYLRSFLDDRKSTLTPESGAAIVMGVVPPRYLPTPWRYLFHFHPVRVLRIFLGRSVDTSEEQLALFFRKYGPFVAIGRPGETFSTPGASRMYVTNEEWQDVVLEHLETSQVILLQPAKTEGIWWEVEKTFARVDPRRVLLCMVNFHNRQNDYERFRVRAEAFLGHPLPRNLAYTETAVFLYFDADWRPMVQQVSCRAPVTWPFVGDTVDLQYTLQPFLNSAGIGLPSQAVAETGEGVAETGEAGADTDEADADTDEADAQPEEDDAANAGNDPTSAADDAATHKAPVTSAPVTNAPVTNAPVTNVPVTNVPVTNVPVVAAIAPRPPKGISATSQTLGVVVNFALLLAIPISLSAVAAKFSLGRTEPDSEWSDGEIEYYDFGDSEFDSGELAAGEAEAVAADVPDVPLDEAGLLRKEGVELYRKGELEPALAKLNESIELNQEDPATLVSRGDALESLGRRDEAIKDYRRALELDPKFTLGWNNLGYTYLQLSKPDEAVECFTKAIELAPDNANFYSDRGIAHVTAGRIDQGLSDFTKALEIDPKRPYTYYQKGKALAGKEQWLDAIQHFNAALQLNPEITDAHLQRGRSFLAVGDRKSEDFNPYEMARNDFDVCLEKVPTATYVLFDRAEANRRDGKIDEAIADFDRILESKPDDAVALERRMKLLLEVERTQEAVAEADRIAELFPNDPSKQILPAAMMFTLKRYDEALTKADAVIASHPDVVDAHNIRGNSLFFLNRSDEAVEAFKQALVVKPGDAESVSNLAAVFAQTDRYGPAAYRYRRLIKIQPGQFDPRFFLCYAQAGQENWDAFARSRATLNEQFGANAAPQLQTLMLRLDLLGPRSAEVDWSQKNELAKSLHQLNPDHGDLAFIDGAMRARAGQLDDAESILQELMDATDDQRITMSARLWLAVTQAKLGKTAVAMENLAAVKSWVDQHAAPSTQPSTESPDAIRVAWWQRVEFQDWLAIADDAVNKQAASEPSADPVKQ